MTNDHSMRLQLLLARLRQGDDSARQALIEHAYEQLRVLARKNFHRNFPRLESIHETSSVVHEAALRLLKALRKVQPTTPREFFALASIHIRRVLIDFAKQHDRTGRRGPSESAARRPEQAETAEPLDGDGEPPEQAIWTEFHLYVEQLPQEERDMVDLHVYQGFSQAETGQLLGIPEKTVNRLWRRTCLRLRKRLPGWDDLFKERKLPYDA